MRASPRPATPSVEPPAVPATGPEWSGSVLDTGPGAGVERRAAPACLGDLRLDRVVALLTAGRDAADLAPRFSATLRDPGEVAYRQEAFRDLEPTRPSAVDAVVPVDRPPARIPGS